MDTLDAIRERHAGDAHTGLPLTASDGHRQVHADRGALLDMLDAMDESLNERLIRALTAEATVEELRLLLKQNAAWADAVVNDHRALRDA